LAWIVVGSFPFYVALSAGVTPIFRQRLERKFDRGAENQAFLVESVSGIQTLKAMAIEPQMQRRWEEQLAGYVGASFDVLSLGNWTSQAVQFISKIVTALTLYFGAYLVIEGQLTVGELIAFNMLGGPGRPTGAAVRTTVAGLPSSASLDRATSVTSSIRRRSLPSMRPAPLCRRSAATSRSITSTSATGSMTHLLPCTTSRSRSRQVR
jgi:ABC-type multidrug transport system fused ATPase/permease subunit